MSSQSKSDDDEDWFSLEPAAPAASNSRSEEALRDALGAQDDLFEEPVQKPKDASRVAVGNPKPTDREYSISCKVCKTLLTVSESKTGTKVKCPDCHSMLVVPPPVIKKSGGRTKIDELGATVQLAPVDGHNPRIVSGASVNSKEILSKASKELERERLEIETINSAFDSKEWLSRTLGFVSDLRLVIALVVLGLVFASGYFAQALIPLNAESGLMSMLQRFREDFLFLITAPAQLALFICAVAVIPKAANREKKIEPWPFFQNIKEYLGPAFVGLGVFLLTNIFSNLLAGGLAVIGIPLFLRESLAETVQWGCLPIIYLSMLELRSYTKPFSMRIFKSITAKSDAWGAMYMQTGLAWVTYFVFWQLGIVRGAVQSSLAGFVFPWFICFVANQYGVLAGRISDVTELGYEGVFTDNE